MSCPFLKNEKKKKSISLTSNLKDRAFQKPLLETLEYLNTTQLTSSATDVPHWFSLMAHNVKSDKNPPTINMKTRTESKSVRCKKLVVDLNKLE